VPTQVDYLFFTHHHFDHDVDYPCFLLTCWDQSVGRENLLRVWGAPRSRPRRLSSRCWWHSRWHSTQTDSGASGARQVPRSRNDLYFFTVAEGARDPRSSPGDSLARSALASESTP
jgi:ribonuclease BN (tRNA processing enzyme)